MEYLQKRDLSKMVNKKGLNRLLNICLLIMVSLFINTVQAVDNPDAMDYLGEFKTREQSYLEIINNPNNGSREYLISYNKYQSFLDRELNKAYRLVKENLSEKGRLELKQSQLNWIKFRDTEFKLINGIWISPKFGSSAGVSRGSYRSTIIRDRVIQLLNYQIGM